MFTGKRFSDANIKAGASTSGALIRSMVTCFPSAFSIGGVVKHSMVGNKAGVVYVYDQFENDTHDPQVAYKADSVKSPMKVSEQSALKKQ